MATAPTLQTTFVGNGGIGGSASASITVGAGSNQLLVIVAGTNAGSIGTPTFGGSSTGITNILTAVQGGANLISVWYLKNPTQTTANLAVTGTSNTAITAYLFKDVDLTTPIGASTSDLNTSSTQSLSLTIDRSNSIIVSGLTKTTTGSATVTGTNQTLGDEVFTGSVPYVYETRQTTTSVGSYTQSFSTSGSVAWAMISVEVHGIPVTTTLSCATGNYSLSGKTTLFPKTLHLVLATGSYVLTGISNTMTKAHAYTLSLATGLYTLTGQSIFLKLVQWIRPTKSSTSWNDNAKDNSSFSNNSKNSSSWNDQSKS